MLGRNKLVMCETYKYNKDPTGKEIKIFYLVNIYI
jgi:hypothetical protein